MSSAEIAQRFRVPGGCVPGACLESLCHHGLVLEAKKRTGAPKIVEFQAPDGDALILKLWYPDRWLSSNLVRPYATRFRNNASRLEQQNFLAPRVVGWGSIVGTRTTFVCYRRVPGRPLSRLLPAVDLAAAGRFVARLHQVGVDFRSLHMGNILWSPSSGFGLIDVTDCDFDVGFSPGRRARRLTYFCTHDPEREHLAEDGNWQGFVTAYCNQAGLPPGPMLRRIGSRAPALAAGIVGGSRKRLMSGP